MQFKDNNNITSSNLIISLLYLSIRTCFTKTWLNNRDQFTAPFEKPQDNFKMGQEKHYLYEDDMVIKKLHQKITR